MEGAGDARPRRTRRLQRIAFWGSLLLAITSVVVGYRYSAAPADLCIRSLDRLGVEGGVSTVQLPFRQSAEGSTQAPRVERLRFAFRHDPAAPQPQAISIGEGLPFYRLSVNGADVLPEVDLAADDVRDMAPHLHVLPADVLVPGINFAQLELPFDARLGNLQLDEVCVGSRAILEPPFRANRWRMVYIPAILVMLFGVLIALAAALWLVSARPPAYAWYIACVALMMARALYVSTSARPGTPVFWMLPLDIAVALLPYALYRFMSAYWHFSIRWLARLMLWTTLLALACHVAIQVAPDASLSWIARAVTLLGGALCGLLALAAMARTVRDLQRFEQGVVVWIGLFAAVCASMEVANLFLPTAQRWMWTNPPAVAALAIGFGYLLLRRLALGADLFVLAADTLAEDLDQALVADGAPAVPAWTEVSARISRRERSRMMRDIHDGFGSRLVSVMSQARRELPRSSLHRQIQRALLDMRLMLDAMDEASRSLALALARLRHRIEPAFTTAGIASEWPVTAVDGVQIDDRRKLMNVFRCLEELLANCIEHAHARRVVLDTQVIGTWVRFRVEDDGCGFGAAAPASGAGLRQVRMRTQALGGTLWLGAGREGRGTLCVFSVPLF